MSGSGAYSNAYTRGTYDCSSIDPLGTLTANNFLVEIQTVNVYTMGQNASYPTGIIKITAVEKIYSNMTLTVTIKFSYANNASDDNVVFPSNGNHTATANVYLIA